MAVLIDYYIIFDYSEFLFNLIFLHWG